MTTRGRTSRGMGLVEVLVGFVLVAMLSAGIMKMMSGSMKGARNVAASMGHQAMKGNLSVLLANPDICKDTFTGLPFGATSPLTVKRGTQIFAQQGDAFDGMTISRLQANIGAIGAGNISLATVTLETTRDAGSQLAGAKKSETVYVNLLTNGTSLLRCVGTDTEPAYKLLGEWVHQIAGGQTYTTNGTYLVGFADHTARGNYGRVTYNANVNAIGFNNNITLYMALWDTNTGLWLDGLPGVPICGERGQAPTENMQYCAVTRVFPLTPGHTYRFELRAGIVLASTPPPGHGIPGNIAILVSDFLRP